MKVTYIEKGPVFDYRRIDHVRTFHAISSWQPEGTGLIYFRLDRYNLKTVPAEDIVKVEDELQAAM